MKLLVILGFLLPIILSTEIEKVEHSDGLLGMVRSLTRNVPANLAVGPFNIDTRNYANTLVNLCKENS